MRSRLTIRVGALAAAVACATAAPAYAQGVTIDSDTFGGLSARAIGPAAMSGRISALDAVAGDRLTIYAGSAGGGLWRSVDGGLVFKPVFDKYASSIGAVTVDPSNRKIVWVGTGESWVRNSVSPGDGVYRSVDGGDSWTRLGLEQSERIDELRKGVLARMACHAVVRAGRGLERPEMEALLRELDSKPDLSTCPHGRPVRILFSLREIEKRFQRT